MHDFRVLNPLLLSSLPYGMRVGAIGYNEDEYDDILEEPGTKTSTTSVSPSSYNNTLKKLIHPSATDIVKTLQYFVSRFTKAYTKDDIMRYGEAYSITASSSSSLSSSFNHPHPSSTQSSHYPTARTTTTSSPDAISYCSPEMLATIPTMTSDLDQGCV